MICRCSVGNVYALSEVKGCVIEETLVNDGSGDVVCMLFLLVGPCAAAAGSNKHHNDSLQNEVVVVRGRWYIYV